MLASTTLVATVGSVAEVVDEIELALEVLQCREFVEGLQHVAKLVECVLSKKWPVTRRHRRQEQSP